MPVRLIRTLRLNVVVPPSLITAPADLIELANWDIALPVSRSLNTVSTTIASGSNGQTLPQATISVASTSSFTTSGELTIGSSTITYTGKTSTTFTGCSGGTGTLATGQTVTLQGTPYAGDELKYLNNTNANAIQSNCATAYPIARLNNDWFYVEQCPIDSAWEIVGKSPIFGSCSNPFEGSDHTRVEFRSRLAGSAPPSSKGEFLQVDKARLRGLCRPIRWPDNDSSGRPALPVGGSISHNLTMYQIHDLSLVFVIVLLRKKTNGLGRIEFTSRNVDGSARPTVVLHDDVPLGSLFEYELVWGPDANLYSKTRVNPLVDGAFTGFGSLNTQTIACDPLWANRPQYYKALTYHGTDPTKSTDYLRGAVVNGVLPYNEVTDYAQINYRDLVVDFAP